jgi:hypothetical protein
MSRNKDMKVYKTKVKVNLDSDALIRKLSHNKRSFMVRETPFLTQIIYNNEQITFTKRNDKFPSGQLWVFRQVSMDSQKFVESVMKGEKEFNLPERKPVNKTNIDYDDSYGVLTGTDVNSAYWTIAKNLGVISEKTHDKVIGEEFKVTRLAALAILGRNFVYKQYKEGEVQKDPYIYMGSEITKNLYKAIRYTCYEHMENLSQLLGDDFDAYRTDCIYYRDTPENRKKVYDYLDSHGFYYKQLEFEEN